MTPSNLDPELLRQALAKIKPQPVAKSRARVLPTKYQHVICCDWFRVFTWPERFKILFGYKLNVLIRLRAPHNPGNCDPVVAGEVTPYTTPSELLRSRIEKDLAKLNTAPTIE